MMIAFNCQEIIGKYESLSVSGFQKKKDFNCWRVMSKEGERSRDDVVCEIFQCSERMQCENARRRENMRSLLLINSQIS
jgi:hypothetical protein